MAGGPAGGAKGYPSTGMQYNTSPWSNVQSYGGMQGFNYNPSYGGGMWGGPSQYGGGMWGGAAPQQIQGGPSPLVSNIAASGPANNAPAGPQQIGIQGGPAPWVRNIAGGT